MVLELLQDKVLTVRDVAELLHVHPNTVRMWTNRGLLRAYRLGSRGDRRFTGRDLEEFISRNAADFGLMNSAPANSAPAGR